MARPIIVGIDIGTSLTKVIIAEELVEHGHLVPKIIGTGSNETKGVIRGYIADSDEAAKSIEVAVAAIPPAISINKKIINTVPIEYKIDGQTVWGQALGLKAEKLEVKALFITCLEHHLNSLISTIEMIGLEVVDIVASPVALSFVTLSKKQKRVGCLLIDLGAETLSMVVFENNNLI